MRPGLFVTGNDPWLRDCEFESCCLRVVVNRQTQNHLGMLLTSGQNATVHYSIVCSYPLQYSWLLSTNYILSTKWSVSIDETHQANKSDLNLLYWSQLEIYHTKCSPFFEFAMISYFLLSSRNKLCFNHQTSFKQQHSTEKNFFTWSFFISRSQLNKNDTLLSPSLSLTFSPSLSLSLSLSLLIFNEDTLFVFST